MAWLWTDALAALLVEHDRVEGTRLAAWVERPQAHRLPEGGDPIDLARDLLRRQADPEPKRGFIAP
ncbi:MAG: hypothetical protein FJW79_03930 [Actinobacteria bacterium]|nr:hypothetical protein [Actinomycetota bacterium]